MVGVEAQGEAQGGAQGETHRDVEVQDVVQGYGC